MTLRHMSPDGVKVLHPIVHESDLKQSMKALQIHPDVQEIAEILGIFEDLDEELDDFEDSDEESE